MCQDRQAPATKKSRFFRIRLKVPVSPRYLVRTGVLPGGPGAFFASPVI